MTSPMDFEVPDFNALRAKLEVAGVQPREAVAIAGTYVLSFLNQRQRVFGYSKDLAPVAPGCQSTFTPRFQHQPWTDGEDVVQAGETPGGDIGFNRRFSNIEFDLNDLAQGLKDIYGCMASLRADVSTLLGELRSEINRINGDLFRLTQGDTTTVPPKLGAIAGSRYLGTANVMGKNFQLWDTQQGAMMLPLITTIAAKEIDTRVARVADLGTVLKTNTALRKRLDAGALTKAELVTAFGDVRTDSGPLRDLVAILPDTQRISGADALVDLVAEREASALRTGPGADLAFATAFGVEEKVTTVGTVAVEKFTAVPAEARVALAAAGIDTMDKLAAVDDKKLASALKTGGVTATPGAPAGWRAAAKALVSVGRTS